MSSRFERSRRWVIAAVVLGSALPGPLLAQEANEVELDRVVAVVGDSVVLLSQLLQREAEMRAQGLTLPQVGTPQRDGFLRGLLEDLVSNQILLQAAAQDTLLEVDDERVEEALQQRISSTEEAFGGRTDMERALQLEGLSIQSYREMLRGQIRQQQLVGQYIARHGGDGAQEVTEEEMREFFESEAQGLQQRPASITFKQVVLTVAPSDSAKAESVARIDSLLERARAGEDFAQLAIEHSQDPGSAEAGGDLGWFRRGNFAEAFEDAAFNLLEGQISDVIETPFGYHIIKVERVRFAERQARHILIRPDVGPADIERTRQLAAELVVRAETEDFQGLIDEYHDPFMPDSATIPRAQIGQMLSPSYSTAIVGKSSGDLVGPIRFDFRGQERFAVLRVVELREAGAYSYEDLRDQIRSSLLQQKRVEALIEGLRSKTHVELRAN